MLGNLRALVVGGRRVAPQRHLLGPQHRVEPAQPLPHLRQRAREVVRLQHRRAEFERRDAARVADHQFHRHARAHATATDHARALDLQVVQQSDQVVGQHRDRKRPVGRIGSAHASVVMTDAAVALRQGRDDAGEVAAGQRPAAAHQQGRALAHLFVVHLDVGNLGSWHLICSSCGTRRLRTSLPRRSTGRDAPCRPASGSCL